ncbi:hypothetical protein [Variovorax sp. J31P207]|uniref:hypothetical protein n=1 Tax=Variovorax sp. J31P207 TaxID=3053510 RepID=UPI0025781219|nr:hypothetical protein [Variovorax sp. J31P207]MDM0072081.1 hypothetical protein [Variovorax sp. J31P207]
MALTLAHRPLSRGIVVMANAEGSEQAFDRLLGTAQFVLKTMPKKPAQLRTVQ